MTSTLRLTLLADGPSDACLLILLRWLVGTAVRDAQFESWFADLGVDRKPPKKLDARIRRAIELYPCDILFVHRDAESQPADDRYAEIQRKSSPRHHPPLAWPGPLPPTRPARAA
jgi:hypothetical protein